MVYTTHTAHAPSSPTKKAQKIGRQTRTARPCSEKRLYSQVVRIPRSQGPNAERAVILYSFVRASEFWISMTRRARRVMISRERLEVISKKPFGEKRRGRDVALHVQRG